MPPSKKLCKKCSKVVCHKPKNKRQRNASAPRTMFKTVKNGGTKLSASFYFNVLCNSKLKRCKPQWILQPDGSEKLKKIKIANGATGWYPMWVKA